MDTSDPTLGSYQIVVCKLLAVLPNDPGRHEVLNLFRIRRVGRDFAGKEFVGMIVFVRLRRAQARSE